MVLIGGDTTTEWGLELNLQPGNIYINIYTWAFRSTTLDQLRRRCRGNNHLPTPQSAAVLCVFFASKCLRSLIRSDEADQIAADEGEFERPEAYACLPPERCASVWTAIYNCSVWYTPLTCLLSSFYRCLCLAGRHAGQQRHQLCSTGARSSFEQEKGGEMGQPLAIPSGLGKCRCSLIEYDAAKRRQSVNLQTRWVCGIGEAGKPSHSRLND